MSDIGVLLTLPSSGRKFPKSLPYGNGSGFVQFPLKKFQQSMGDSFLAMGQQIDEGFFDYQSGKYPHNLSMLALAVETMPDLFYGVDPYDVGRVFGQKREIVGGIVVEKEKIWDFEFNYLNKVFVVPELWNNGLAGRMLRALKELKMPSVLKTSISENSAKYSKYSDATEKIGPYDFHGFNFVDKETGREKFLGAKSKFYAAARHIIEKKPVTVHPIQNGAVPDYNLPLFPKQNLY